LYASVWHGGTIPEIRLPTNAGIIGQVFTTGTGVIVPDAYAEPRFNAVMDRQTGYKTENIVCVPIKTRRGLMVGVAQALNKIGSAFTAADLKLLNVIMRHVSFVLHGTLTVARMRDSRQREADFFNSIADISSEIQLGRLLRMIMAMATKMLDA